MYVNCVRDVQSTCFSLTWFQFPRFPFKSVFLTFQYTLLGWRKCMLVRDKKDNHSVIHPHIFQKDLTILWVFIFSHNLIVVEIFNKSTAASHVFVKLQTVYISAVVGCRHFHSTSLLFLISFILPLSLYFMFSLKMD